MMISNLRRMIFVAAFAVAIFGLLASRAAVAGSAPVQIHLDHWQNGGTIKTNSTWVDGNLHKTNSHYGEGDFIPTRYVMDNLPPGTYSLTFEWLAAKAQGAPGRDRVKHAHDYMATFNQSGSLVTGVDPCLPRVQGQTGNICGTGNLTGDSQIGVPLDPFLAGGGFTGVQAAGQFRMWKGTITAVSGYDYTPPAGPGGQPNFLDTTTNRLTIVNFTVSGPGNKDVVLAFGARLARANEWDSLADLDTNPNNEKDGACDISGAPYHWFYELVDAAGNKLQSGNRDRSIMCTGGNPGTITVEKRCFVGTNPDGTDHEVLTDPFGNDIPFTFSSPTIGPLIGNDGDNFFDVVCGSSAGTAIAAGIHTVTELAPGDLGNSNNNGFGWELRNISCVGTITNGGNVSTYRYLGDTAPPIADAFGLGDRTAEINLGNGDNVTCTFKNYQAEMPLHKLINGESATCSHIDPRTGGVVYNTAGDDTGIRPCKYVVPDPDLVLTDTDPRFTFDLYFATGDGPNDRPTAPTVFPSPALASARIPPLFEAPGLVGIPLTLCEEPSGAPFNFLSVAIILTPNPNTGTGTLTINPSVYQLVTSGDPNGFVFVPPFAPHNFPAGTYSCFNIKIPSGTTKFEINSNNSVVCSITQGGWFAPPQGTYPNGNWASLLQSFFPSVYPSGLVVGDNGGLYTLTFTSSAAVSAASPGGTPGPLNNNYVNPICFADTGTPGSPNFCSGTGSGNFGSQVVALRINVDGVFPNAVGIGGLTLTGTGTSLDGRTIAQILGIANTALGNGGFPSSPTPGWDQTISSLTGLLGDFINPSFDECRVPPTQWALDHLK